MPLLNNVPFERTEIRENIKDHEEVFYCAATGEAFEDYESFCERVLIVNSVVWTCSITGKSNMTFEEATACEENAREMLKEFPVELRIPALYLASLTQRTSLENLAEDVFSFAKERYFVGESVEVNFKDDVWTESHVIQVIAPPKSEAKVDGSGVRFVSLPASSFRYEVEASEHSESGEQEVPAQKVRRRKGSFTRDRNRLYLKQFAEVGPDGIWRIKKEALKTYGIPRVKFENIFVGSAPVFQVSKNAARVKKNQTSMDRYLTVSNSQNKKKSPTKPQSSTTPQKQAALKVKEKYRQVKNGGVTKRFRKEMVMSVEKLQLLREKQLEERKRKLEERVIERAKLKEEKQRLAELMKQWSRQREDLECEDLKLLPTPAPVQCRIPNENLGDFLTVVEFFSTFSDVLNTREFFPYGVTLDLVERAFLEQEVAGPLSDMLQFLLQQLFRMQEEEDDEIQTADVAVDVEFTDADDVSTSEAIRLATAATGWCQKYQGTALCKLALDSVTVSEVLRLHLLSSGGRCSEVNCKWRYQQRGGYTSRDDPGLRLRMEHPHILRSLAVHTVFDLPLADKLLVMSTLMDQILTYASLRDVVDERCEKYRVVRAEFKTQQAVALRREKELAAARVRQRKDRRLHAKAPEATSAAELAQADADVARLEKEVARTHADMQRKISEANAVATGHRLLPLGTDRAHRRYWLFPAVPGLFVEHDPSMAGPCMLAPTPRGNSLDAMAYVRRLFEEEKTCGGSDKENEESPAPKKPRLEDSPASPNKEVSTGEELLCSASADCPVHGTTVGTVRWSLITSVEQLQALLDGLNPRGVREGDLRQNLLDDWTKITQAVAKCPVAKLTNQTPDAGEERKASVRATYNTRYMDANLNFPSGTPPEDIFELTMRDLIADLEEKIHCGGLGSLKVFSREAWRAAILGRGYDKQCSQLIWPSTHQSTAVSENSPKANSRGSSSPVCEAEPVDYKDPGRFLSAQEQSSNPVVTDLAGAILQLGQSLEKKYRQKPLVPEGDDWSQIERWETSLMNSTCFSQLFVHYYTLESSIQWSKSALNANCRLCRRRGDAENMLLCDNCNKGHHLYCLKPKLTKIPKGDWFCPKCRPEVKTPRTAPRRRTIFQEEEEEEDEEEEDEETGDPPLEVCHKCGEGGHVICCDTESCARVFHIECLDPPLRKVPRGKWYCPVCKRQAPPAAGAKGSDRDWRPSQSKSRRGCANAAVAKISQFAKRIRSGSWDNDSSSATSEDTAPARRSARMSLEPDLDLPLNNALLQDLLTEVMHHEDAWPFLRPVAKAQVPDYHLIIKRPMDLGTMKNKLNMLNYTNNSEFIADANLVFENCKMYNQADTPEYKAGVALRKFFKKRCKELRLSSLELQED